MKDFSKWVEKAPVPVENIVMSKTEEKLSKQRSEMKESPCLISNKAGLRELETVQTLKVLRAFLPPTPTRLTVA